MSYTNEFVFENVKESYKKSEKFCSKMTKAEKVNFQRKVCFAFFSELYGSVTVKQLCDAMEKYEAQG